MTVVVQLPSARLSACRAVPCVPELQGRCRLASSEARNKEPGPRSGWALPGSSHVVPDSALDVHTPAMRFLAKAPSSHPGNSLIIIALRCRFAAVSSLSLSPPSSLPPFPACACCCGAGVSCSLSYFMCMLWFGARRREEEVL